MCGIVGAFSFEGLDPKMEEIRREAIVYLVTELLYMTHTRGKDATGMAALFEDGNYYGLKMGIPSPDFITRFGAKESDYDGFMKVVRKSKAQVKAFIGHCRKTSVGNSDDNANNHPVKVGNIIGIHNGTLTNHDKIFTKLKCKRDGEVDSEAIMRLVHYLSKEGKEPFTLPMIKEVCLRLNGTYSCIVMNGDNPNQVATFRDGKPSEMVLIRPLNLVMVASEKDFLKEVLVRFNKMAMLYPTTINFPCLTKDDVELKTMPDDSCAVFDLTTKIVADTKMEDLFSGQKILRVDKLWREAGKGTYGYGVHGNRNAAGYNANQRKTPNQNNRGTGTTAGKTEVGAKGVATGTSDDDESTSGKPGESSKSNGDGGQGGKKGRVWDKGLKGFSHHGGVEEAKKIGGVEIDVDSDSFTRIYGGEKPVDDPSKITIQTDEGDEELVLELDPDDIEEVVDTHLSESLEQLGETSNEKFDELIGDPGEIESPDFPDYVEYTEHPTGEPESANLIEHLKKTMREPDADVVKAKMNMQAMERASEIAEELPRYESDEELLSDLGITDESIVKNAPLYALANRILKNVFKAAYYAGFVDDKESEKKTPTRVGDLEERKTRAERNIRIMKTMVKMLSSALGADSSTYTAKKENIDRAVTSEFNQGNTISSEDVDKLFSAGDLRDNPELVQLKTIIMGKEHR